MSARAVVGTRRARAWAAVVATCAAAAALVVGVVVHRAWAEGARPSSPRGNGATDRGADRERIPGCSLSVGSVGAFAVSLDARAEVDLQAVAAGVVGAGGTAPPARRITRRTRVDGRLDWVVRTATESEVELAMHLAGVTDAARIAEPIGLVLGLDCRVLRVAFRRDASASDVERARAVVRGLDVALADEARWEATHDDGVGRVVTRYERMGSSRIARRRLRYEAVRGGGANAPVPRLLRGASVLEVDSGGWLREIESSHHVRVTDRGRVVLDAEDRFVATRVSSASGPSDVVGLRWIGLDDAWAAAQTHRAVGAQARTLDLDTVRERLRTLVGTPGPGHAEAVDLVTAALADAGEKERWVSALRAGELSRAEEELVFHGLRRIGDENTLATLATERGTSPENVARALHALARLEEPTSRATDVLVAAATDRGDGERRSVGMLSLGTHGARASARSDAPTADRVAGVVRDALGDAQPSELATALSAARNARNPALLDAIVTHLDAEEPGLRVLAAGALSRTPGALAAERLAAAVTGDPSADARRAAAAALEQRAAAGLEGPGRDAITRALHALTREQDVEARRALIGWLGSCAASDAEVRAALVAQFARETDDFNRALIGRFVSARELAR